MKKKLNTKQKKFKFDALKELAKINKDLACIFCGKKITQKVWDSQAPYVLDCYHSLGGPIGSYGDYVFNATFCSRRCLDNLIRICKDFTYIDWLIGSADVGKNPIKKIIQDKKMMNWLNKLSDKKQNEK